jgi:hypothetical protein
MGSLRAIEVFRDPRYRLIAIESIELVQHHENPVCLLSGRAEPVALIVCGAGGIDALDMRSETVDLDRLRREVPELDSMIST